MSECPMVSIITPCYNAEIYIDVYMEKMLQQTYKNIQLIFVDDGSKDNTKSKLFSYKEQLEKEGFTFTYCFQENKGVGAAVNTGLKLIKGEFFAWCDCDCFYDKTYVQKCIEIFNENKDLNIIRCDGAYVKAEDKSKITKKYSDGYTNKTEKKQFENAVFEKNFHVGCAMIRTAEFDRINPKREIFESRQGQNWPLLIPILYENDCEYIDEVLFFNVFSENSVSNISAKKGLTAVMEQDEEYKRILYNVINGLNMTKEEKKSYLDRIDVKYLHRSLSFAHNFKNKQQAIESYNLLKNRNELNKTDKLNYYRATNIVLDNICHLLGKLKNIK